MRNTLNVMFFGYTPYHIKMSNYIADKKYGGYNKVICLTEVDHTSSEKLKKIVNGNLFNEVEIINFNFKIKTIIKNISKINKYKESLNLELKKVIDLIEKNNPQEIVIYNDCHIAYQIIINYIRENLNSNIVFVEEGTARYIVNEHRTLKDRIAFYINKFMYGYKNVELISHGKNNNIDIAYLREPQLVNYTNERIKKIKIDKEEYREIINYFSKKTSIFHENSALFVPTTTTYDKKYMIDIFRKIFNLYYDRKKNLYVKLHPHEKYSEDIISLIQKYNRYIHLIDESDVTSDDYIMNKNIDTIISDYSSTLINAYYVRDDIELLTYCDILEKDYKIKYKYEVSIFNMLIKNSVIKKINI